MPFQPGVGGGSHPGNRSGKRGRPLRPVPTEITRVALSTLTPLPCSIRKTTAGNPNGICGKPATAGYVYPHTSYHSPGCWIVQPVCRECAMAAANVYEGERE